MAKILLVVVLAVSALFGMDLAIFPKPKEGMIMQVIRLKPLKDEQNYKVEVEFGKTMKLDCNHYFFTGGELFQNNLEGYGYVYYEFDGKGEVAGTMMMCQDAPKDKFVKFVQNISTFYDSKTPIIIYTSKDVEIGYKVYKLVDEEFLKVQK